MGAVSGIGGTPAYGLPNESTEEESTITYVVKKGDTANHLALMLGVDRADIVDSRGRSIEERDHLTIYRGETLHVKGGGHLPADVPANGQTLRELASTYTSGEARTLRSANLPALSKLHDMGQKLPVAAVNVPERHLTPDQLETLYGDPVLRHTHPSPSSDPIRMLPTQPASPPVKRDASMEKDEDDADPVKSFATWSANHIDLAVLLSGEFGDRKAAKKVWLERFDRLLDTPELGGRENVKKQWAEAIDWASRYLDPAVVITGEFGDRQAARKALLAKPPTLDNTMHLVGFLLASRLGPVAQVTSKLGPVAAKVLSWLGPSVRQYATKLNVAPEKVRAVSVEVGRAIAGFVIFKAIADYKQAHGVSAEKAKSDFLSDMIVYLTTMAASANAGMFVKAAKHAKIDNLPITHVWKEIGRAFKTGETNPVFEAWKETWKAVGTKTYTEIGLAISLRGGVEGINALWSGHLLGIYGRFDLDDILLSFGKTSRNVGLGYPSAQIVRDAFHGVLPKGAESFLKTLGWCLSRYPSASVTSYLEKNPLFRADNLRIEDTEKILDEFYEGAKKDLSETYEHLRLKLESWDEAHPMPTPAHVEPFPVNQGPQRASDLPADAGMDVPSLDIHPL